MSFIFHAFKYTLQNFGSDDHIEIDIVIIIAMMGQKNPVTCFFVISLLYLFNAVFALLNNI